ncbi:unnamed protein product [Mycena citricolor]|uniref:GH16 domain-containing protein n=1 Tax=Mycena citricolor TaxID=2018698 RepID=A0AAD2JWD3_9AGAR|nr:unnamed protein product [Mycena citricolor]
MSNPFADGPHAIPGEHPPIYTNVNMHRSASATSSTSSFGGRGGYPSVSRDELITSEKRSSAGSGSGSVRDAEKYNMSADPAVWGVDLTRPEIDDALHEPEAKSADGAKSGIFTGRGVRNIGCLALIVLLIVGVFVAFPVVTHFRNQAKSNAAAAAANGGVNNAQLQNISNVRLIDVHTPKEAYTINGYHDSTQPMKLVFSDEFEVEGRSFYPGDDPYWEAADLYYWSTNDLEWYDPKQITTKNGALEITLDQVADPTTNHNLNYTSGMMTTWNKFCFTGGLILASVTLPGTNDISGLWPAVWTMGNLGRAGYGATLDGMWPYSYDSCDVGTLPNQTANGAPIAATDSGANNGPLSFLPGQRLSRCTCKGESHPGPLHSDGTFVGRSAPEIDIFEAQISGSNGNNFGQVSQSAQWAPFDSGYSWDNSTTNLIIPNPAISQQNSFNGNLFQEASSVVSNTNQSCYELLDGCFAINGFEYVPGYDNAYITWISNNQVSWTLNAGAVGPNAQTQVSARPITDEPLYILMNLAISHNFAFIDPKLKFPAKMRVDWVRVYQHPDKINIGCDPKDRPTQSYINTYIEAYTNPNLTTWVDDFKQVIPKNNLTSQC